MGCSLENNWKIKPYWMYLCLCLETLQFQHLACFHKLSNFGTISLSFPSTTMQILHQIQCTKPSSSIINYNYPWQLNNPRILEFVCCIIFSFNLFHRRFHGQILRCWIRHNHVRHIINGENSRWCWIGRWWTNLWNLWWQGTRV